MCRGTERLTLAPVFRCISISILLAAPRTAPLPPFPPLKALLVVVEAVAALVPRRCDVFVSEAPAENRDGAGARLAPVAATSNSTTALATLDTLAAVIVIAIAVAIVAFATLTSCWLAGAAGCVVMPMVGGAAAAALHRTLLPPRRTHAWRVRWVMCRL